MKRRIAVVGLGGVGSWLLQGLCPFLQYQQNDTTWQLVVVDGDDYEDKNHSRQSFEGLGSKAEVQAEWIAQRFPDLEVVPVTSYIAEKAIKGTNGAKDAIAIAEVVRDGDLVFSCVDNHRTRKVLAKHCSTLNNVILISGGNDYTDGNVQFYLRREGQDLTPNIDKYHPEIAKPKDKAPYEMSCEEAAVSYPQLIFANMTCAVLMLNAFYSFMEGKLDPEKSEIYFDILINNAVARVRKK